MISVRKVTLATLLCACSLLTSSCSEDALAQPVVTAPAQLSQPNLEQLRATLEQASEEAGTQGVLFGMWIGDREVMTTALGHSMTSVPASTDMHWRLGGVTETFQCTLLWMLAEQGAINLDSKISRWMPELLSADKVTVRMLANCSAGYLDYVVDPEFDALVTAEPFRQFSSEELIHYAVKDGKMNYQPGTSQRYSHTEYTILGEVMERATGKSMAELYKTNILDPMGLTNTHYTRNQEMPQPVLHAFTKDRGVYEDCTYYNPSWGSHAGALMSNLHDIGKWGPIFGEGKLLSAASWAEMTAPTTLGGNKPDLRFCNGFVYANGWYIQNPSMNGYSGGFGYNPATGVTLMVAATKDENPRIDPAAIHILKEMVKHITPDTPLNF